MNSPSDKVSNETNDEFDSIVDLLISFFPSKFNKFVGKVIFFLSYNGVYYVDWSEKLLYPILDF